MRIDFIDPTHHKGLNSTVRLGPRVIPADTKIHIFQTGEKEPTHKGVVINTKVTQYKNLTLEDIKYQHSEDTRNFNGLWKAMIRAYGDKITPESVVTVVYYIVE
jgi:hypothetical protein